MKNFLRALAVVAIVAGAISVFLAVRERRREALVRRVIAKPDRFLAFRIGNQSLPQYMPLGGGKLYRETVEKGPHIWQYPVLYGVEVRDPQVIADAAALLRDPRRYPPPRNSEERNTCVPEPGIAFQFWRGAEHVEVVMCFRCTEIWLFPAGWGYFSGIRPQLASVVHRSLPRERTFDIPADEEEQRAWDPGLNRGAEPGRR